MLFETFDSQQLNPQPETNQLRTVLLDIFELKLKAAFSFNPQKQLNKLSFLFFNSKREKTTIHHQIML